MVFPYNPLLTCFLIMNKFFSIMWDDVLIVVTCYIYLMIEYFRPCVIINSYKVGKPIYYSKTKTRKSSCSDKLEKPNII